MFAECEHYKYVIGTTGAQVLSIRYAKFVEHELLDRGDKRIPKTYI